MFRTAITTVAAALLFAAPAHAQVVQLPTFQQFTVSTSVMVPDSGGAHLGSVRRIREGSVSRGIPGINKLPGLARLGKNRGIGREANVSMMTAHATIIDMNELDELVLGAAAAARRASGAEALALNRKATLLTAHVSSSERKPPAFRLGGGAPGAAPGVAAIRQAKSSARQAKLAEALAMMKRGDDAEARGKHSVAKIYYQMAARRANGELKKALAIRLEALKGARLANSK